VETEFGKMENRKKIAEKFCELLREQFTEGKATCQFEKGFLGKWEIDADDITVSEFLESPVYCPNRRDVFC
jgi:hypothetical protein